MCTDGTYCDIVFGWGDMIEPVDIGKLRFCVVCGRFIGNLGGGGGYGACTLTRVGGPTAGRDIADRSNV